MKFKSYMVWFVLAALCGVLAVVDNVDYLVGSGLCVAIGLAFRQWPVSSDSLLL